tara:strand:+ start:3486 stop:4856 length:1371 start_codon:yes stop_codon:yes gene_type:complete
MSNNDNDDIETIELSDLLGADSNLNDDEVPNWDRHQTIVNSMAASEGEGYAFLKNGQRHKTTCDWDFQPLSYPVQIKLEQETIDELMATGIYDTNEHGDGSVRNDEIREGFYTSTNTQGRPNHILLLNPKESSENQPIGAPLAVVSDRYAIVSYADLYAPIARFCDRKGWAWAITCYDQGKKARMDIDVTNRGGFGRNAKMNNDATNGMSNREIMKELNLRTGDLYNYGITIHNSLDGSGSLRMVGVAQRVACTNGMVASSKRHLLSLRHTENSIGSIDFDKFGDQIGEMIEDVEKELMFVESLRGKEMTDDLFDRLLVAAQQRKILTLPKAVPIINEGTGEITDYDMQQGHLWQVSRSGWENEDLDWVKVEKESVGTAFHAYQVLTGGLTHKPQWNGPKTRNGEGEKTMNGRTLNLKTLDKRLFDVHMLMRDVAEERVNLENFPTSEEAMNITVA